MPFDKKPVIVLATLIIMLLALLGVTAKIAHNSYLEMGKIKEAQIQEAQFLLSTLDFKTEQQKAVLFIRDVILEEWKRIGYKKGSYDKAFTVAMTVVRESIKYPYMSFPDMALLMAAMLHQESSFNHEAVSSHGARGIAQFMPSTARVISSRVQVEYTDTLLFNVETSIRFQAAYLDIIFASNKYEIEPSLAEYNSGTWGAIYWRTDKSKLSPETRAYVPSIVSRFKNYQSRYKTYQVYLKAADSTFNKAP